MSPTTFWRPHSGSSLKSIELEEALQLERDLFAGVFDTADAREGVSAFLEKRKAEFQGR